MLDRIHYDQRYDSLLEVYRLGSFTAAGNKLGLTPSAIGQQVRSVEQELDTPLFERGERRLIPTRECRVIVKYIEKIHTMCRRMSDDVELSKHNIERLNVGITPSAVSGALSGVIEELSARVLPTRITVTTDSAARLCDMLESYAIDLAIIEGGSCQSDTLAEVMLDTDYLSVILPPDSEYAARGMITPGELQNEPLIMKPPDSGTRRLFNASLAGAGLSPEKFSVIMEVSSVDTIIRLVAGHYGLSVLSSKACAAAAENGRIAAVPLGGINMTRSIRLVYRKNRDCSELIGKIRSSYAAANCRDSGIQPKFTTPERERNIQ